MKTEFKPPQWLQISIIILFIWNLVGIFAFVYDLIPDPSPLDEIRQNFRANFPLWIKIVVTELGLLHLWDLMSL